MDQYEYNKDHRISQRRMRRGGARLLVQLRPVGRGATRAVRGAAGPGRGTSPGRA